MEGPQVWHAFREFNDLYADERPRCRVSVRSRPFHTGSKMARRAPGRAAFTSSFNTRRRPRLSEAANAHDRPASRT